MPVPLIQNGQDGSELLFTETWADEFDHPDQPLSTSPSAVNWKPLDMTEGLHKTGNYGKDINGNIADTSTDFWRWAARYDQHQDEVTYIKDQQLHMGGKLVEMANPTRTAFTDNGTLIEVDKFVPFTSFNVTWDRVYDNSANGGAGGHVTDPNGPDITFGPETYIEFRANFEQMSTTAFRFSAYLLPAYDNASNSYDGTAANGVENDFPEIDMTPGFETYLQAKIIGGAAGQTANGSIDVLSSVGIDPSVGWHTLGLLWQSNRWIWYLDGIEYQRDTALIPTVNHYIVFSREINTGVRGLDNKYRDDRTGGDHAPGQQKNIQVPTDYSRGDMTPGKYWTIEIGGSNQPTVRVDFLAGTAALEAAVVAGHIIPVSEHTQDPGKVVEWMPYRPGDVGIYGSNYFPTKDQIDNDVAKFDYIRTWSVGAGLPPRTEQEPDPGSTTASTAPTRKVTAVPALGGVNDTASMSLDGGKQPFETYEWVKEQSDSEVVFDGGNTEPTAILRSVSDVPVKQTGNVALNIENVTLPHVFSPSAITQATTVFNWSSGNETVDMYQFWLGDVARGNKYLDTGEITITGAANSTPFPSDGKFIYATLRYRVAGVWYDESKVYPGLIAPEFLTPVPNSTITGNSETFTWQYNSAQSDEFIISVGTDANEAQYYNAPIATGTTATVNNLPQDGSMVKVTVQHRETGGSFSSFHAYYISAA